MIITIFSILTLFALFAAPAEKLFAADTTQAIYTDTITTIQQAESHKNTSAIIKGRLQKFTPWTEGKGANHMFWNWEIAFSGGGRIPIVSKDKSDGESINFAEYENMNVIVYGTVFFGIVIGDDNPEHQSARGYRIDADGIMFDEAAPQNLLLDTCRLWKDIEKHWNMTAYLEGKVIEYVPPHDNSKLGDEKIWQWELLTADNYTIPLTAKTPALDINSYIGKQIIVKAFILNGIIFGAENTANIHGTRIDAEEIYPANPEDPRSKIMIDLDDFNDEGLRERPKGEFSSTHYEFCIPASDEAAKEVQGIDPTAGIYKTSKGRSGCSDTEWLVIGKTRQPDFKKVILKLAELSYVRKITETFWE